MSQYIVCPFCHTIHQRSNMYLNIICACGGKYYPCSGEWINRQTGDRVKGLANNRCDCKACSQRKMNYDETGFNCISYAYSIRILKNTLEYVSSLTKFQKDSINITIDTLKKLDEGKSDEV